MPSTLIKTHRSTLIKVGNTLLGSKLKVLPPSEITVSSLSGTEVKSTWVATDEVSIERSTDGVNFTEIDSITGSSFTDSGLTINTKYYYRFRCKKGASYSSYSAIYSDYTAEYFISLTGSNTAPYDTLAKAATAVNTVMAHARTNQDGAGCVVRIKSGDYVTANDYLLLEGMGNQNMIIVGDGADVKIKRPTNVTARIYDANGSEIHNLTLEGVDNSTIFFNTRVQTVKFKDVNIINSDNYNYFAVKMDGGTGIFENCRLSARTPFYGAGASNIYLKNFISTKKGNQRFSGNFSFVTSGTIEIDHSLILDSQYRGIQFAGTGVSVLKNSIVTGAYRSSEYYPVDIVSGSVTLSNNLVIASVYEGDTKFVKGTYTDGGGNLFTNHNPEFKTYPRFGYILPRIDDAGSFGYAKNVEPILAKYGMTGSFFFENANSSYFNIEELRNMIRAGVLEVGSHSYTHSRLSDTGVLMTVIKGDETVTVDRTNNSISLSGGGIVSDFKTKTLGVIKSELESLGATVTNSPIFKYGNVREQTLGEVLASVSATNELSLLIDATGSTGYFNVEIKQPKTWVADYVNQAGDVIDGQTGQIYECRSFGFPYDSGSDDARLATINAGYTTSSYINRSMRDTYSILDIDVYAIADWASSYFSGSNEENTRLRARTMAFAAAHCGLIFGILTHNTTELSYEQWDWMLEEFSKNPNVKVTSRQIMVDEIMNAANGWADDGDGTYSREYSDTAGDYGLLEGSSLIGAADDGGNIGTE